MAVIAVYSMKGGVGKTTMAVDLAWRFSQTGGHETLLYDLDPQGGAGFLLGHEERKVQKAISAFHHARAPRDLIEPTKYDRLSLIGADQSLRDLPVQLVRIGAKKRLAQMLSFMKGEYPRIVLDCPPMINEVSEQIMEAADLIVVPLPASPLAARAFGFIRNELAKRPGHPPVLPVLSMYDQRRKLHRWVRENAGANWPIVPASSYVEQVAVRREPIAAFANWSPAAKGLEHLHHALEAKLDQMGLGGTPPGGGKRALPGPQSRPLAAPQAEDSRVVPIRSASSAGRRDTPGMMQAPRRASEGLTRSAFSF
ncbi:ParA family protein [Alteriqipengyuania sp. NZ-12B]|uniref:ParA family protein n=1 Tax=Alteriqipengyuania abyssalis TaxID=2860200 RepID=A0ABS7PBV1_9SPHN|nr:ParA family protein [Alteriqipengyuania abyssalis]MBY8336541.1 ParA family protein [Alteriqipengyuania abyssalis]